MSEPRQLDDAVEPLVWRARSGDGQALSRLVDWCHKPVYRWALGITSDPDDADDVAQEVLVALQWTLRKFDGRSRFTTWLYRVTRNAALGLLRRERRKERRIERTARERAANADAADVEHRRLERLWSSSVADLVKTFFEELPHKQRAVFDLVDLQGYTPREAAEMLDMKPVTARANLFKARRAIRAAILARHPQIAEEYSK